MPNKTALVLPDALVRYFRGGEIELVKKVETLPAASRSGSASRNAIPSTAGAIPAEASAVSPTLIDRRGGGVWDKQRPVTSGEQFAKFIDDAAVRFVFPRRTLSFQQRMVKALNRRLRNRGAEIMSVRPTIEDYARWCDAQGKPDTSPLHFQFASAPPNLAVELPRASSHVLGLSSFCASCALEAPPPAPSPFRERCRPAAGVLPRPYQGT